MADKKEKIKLAVVKREVIGRKVKVLRREGILPANIYGKKIKSLAVQLETKNFLPVYKEVGETGLVELKVAGEEKTRPVLIHNVHLHAVNGDPLHADFYQVDLKEKITSKVPVELVGESPAVKEKVGILIQLLDEIEVEALPADLPEKIEVDISGLKAVDDLILVEKIKVPGDVEILTDQQEILAKIEPPAKEEEVAPTPEEAPAEGEETAAAETEVKSETTEEKPSEQTASEEKEVA